MRPLEISGLGLLALAFVMFAIPGSKRPRWMHFVPAVPAIALLLQLSVEGYRWQMLPAYVLGAIVLLVGLPAMIRGHRTTRRSGWLLNILALIASLVGLAIVWITVELGVQLPAFSMPLPSGPYAVGTRTFLLVDENRVDDASPLQNGYRSMSIQAWYPAELTGEEDRTTYLSNDFSAAWEALGGPPAWFSSYLDQVQTNAYWNAKPAVGDGGFPVILYSPSGNASLHKILFEELASRGYVAVSISHPHWSNVIFDDQGGVIPHVELSERYQSWLTEENTTAVQTAKGRILGGDTIGELEQAQVNLNRARPVAIPELRQWSGDVGFVLDRLAAMNLPGGFFNGQLDLSRTGVMGFSLGGATAGQFCVTDPRCRAGINIDGFMFGDILDNNLEVPFMFIHSENPSVAPGLAGALFYEWAEARAYMIQIAGATHGDLGAPKPDGQPIILDMEINLSQFPDGAYLARIMNEYILAFFDRHLRGLPAQLLDGPPPFPEVLFMRKDGG